MDNMSKTKVIPFFNTYVDPYAAKLVVKTLNSTFLSEGKLVEEFEIKLHQKLGLANPVAVNSGTSSLHLALILAGVKKGDEVIIPAQTFIATALTVLYLGAKPIFADIIYETGNIDPESIQKKITRKTKAIIPVHWGGYPCNMGEIRKVAKKHDLVIIEDAAHALGASYQGKLVGSISPLTCFSFQAIKHLTTGDGGVVACLRKTDARRAKKLRWFGIDRAHSKASILGERQYSLDEMGYKYHLNDYSAALGIANLKSFINRLKKRQQLTNLYRRELSTVSGINIFEYADDRKSANWLFGVHVEKRTNFIKALISRGITTSVVHQRIDHHPLFGGKDKTLVNQKRFDSTQLHLPLYDSLTKSDVSYIVKSIKKGW